MKKLIYITLCLALLCSHAQADVQADYAKFENYGTVLSADVQKSSATIEAEGYYGYHMDEDPSMTVRMTVNSDCLIEAISVIGAKAQTPGFDAMITQEYIDSAYVGKLAESTLETDMVSGATATSQAVLYAVRTAANYAQQALGYQADTDAADKAELRSVYPAEYTTIVTDYKPNKNEIGTVLYAAEGITEDGTQIVAMKVRSAVRLSYKGSAGTGWTASEPSAFTMIIVVDKATNQVCAWSMVKDGTKRSQYFKVPQEKIDMYKNVAIVSDDVFDTYMDGIVMNLDYELEESPDGPVITGTTIVYTGETQQGTFSSQLVRNCFRTAARMYCHYAE